MAKKQLDRVKNGHYLSKYFTQVPNIIDDSELDPYEFRLLVHYYRVGECWEGVRTTSKKCKMSTGKVADVRKSLVDKGFITIVENDTLGVTIHIVNKASENIEKYDSPKITIWYYENFLIERSKFVLGERCIYCGTLEAGSLDHLIPTSRGGTNDNNNLARSCKVCNMAKGALTDTEFVDLMIQRGWLKKRSPREQVSTEDDMVSISPTENCPPGELKNNTIKNTTLRTLSASSTVVDTHTAEEIDLKRNEFKREVTQVGGLKYTSGMLERFVNTWSQPNKKGKLRWEVERDKKGWSLPDRLRYWASRNLDRITVYLTDEEITIETKKRNFITQLQEFKDQYTRDTLNKFYKYWTEAQPGTNKLRWEDEDFWDLSARLSAWKERNDKPIQR